MSRAAIDVELLASVVESDSNASLKTLRQNALAKFREESGLPTPRHEDWKYTNLAPLAEISNAWLDNRPTAKVGLPDESVAPPAGIDALWITIANGEIDDDALAEVNEALAGKAELLRLSDDNQSRELLLDNAIAALNGALIRDALWLRVAKNVSLESPIGLRLVDFAEGAPAASHVRILIELEDNAAAEVLEYHQSSGGDEHYATVVTEVDLKPGARLSLVKVQQRSARHSQVGQVRARCGKDSSFQHAAVDLGGKTIRNDVTAVLAAAGAHFGSAGLGLTEDGEHIDNHIAADHAVGPATSTQNYRYIASGRSRCVFNGKAIVREGADGTDAEQSNHSLLLSDHAEIDTKPELEIYAEDVKCAHGATVGQLDEKSLFYLRSRGLDKEQAAQLLTRAFANTVLDDVPVAAIRDHLSEAVDAKLDRLVEDAAK